MLIKLNNRMETLPGDAMSVKMILKHMKFTFPRIIVKLNDKLIKKPFYEETIVKDGDTLNVIHLISGG